MLDVVAFFSTSTKIKNKMNRKMLPFFIRGNPCTKPNFFFKRKKLKYGNKRKKGGCITKHKSTSVSHS